MEEVVVNLVRRDCTRSGTVGEIFIEKEHICSTVELPWKHNSRRVSCIPNGRYPMRWKTSPRFGPSWHVEDVPGRTHILIHAGNFQRDTHGCIMPCQSFESDGVDENGNASGACGWDSRAALRSLVEKISWYSDGGKTPVWLEIEGEDHVIAHRSAYDR